MPQYFKRSSLLICLAIGLLLPNRPVKADTPPSVQAPYAVAINAKTGEVLFNKDSHHHAYPASITKLMTVILMEKYMSDKETITASKKAVSQEPSNWFYRMNVGETMSKEDALNALMIVSSNDVAMAVAEKMGGSEAGFAKMMNDEAKNLGLKDTHFVTPNGLHDPNHFTSPYDMAIIAKEVLKYPDILKAMQQNTYIIHTDQQTAEIYRRDKIYDNPIAFGGKTGFTDQAEQTVVEFQKKGTREIIVVVMKDNNYGMYQDEVAIGQYVLNQMKTVTIGEKGKVYQTISVNGTSLPVAFNEDAQVDVTKEDAPTTAVTWLPKEGLKKGVKEGQKVGSLTISLNNQLLKQVDLVATESVPAAPIVQPVVANVSSLQSVWFNRSIVVGLLVLGYFILRPRNSNRRYLDQDQ